MAKIRTLQILRGTTAQNDAYTGSAGELTMDTTTNELRLHDGSTAGGHVIGSGGGGSGYHPDLFSVKWSDHQINDVQWLRGDTFSWQDGSVYQAAYQHLVDDYNNIPTESTIYVYHSSTPSGYFYRDSYFDVSGATHPYAYVRYNNDGSMLVLYANHTTGEASDTYYENSDGSGTYYSGGFTSNTINLRPIKHDTINGTVISFYEAQDGHRISPERTSLDTIYMLPMTQSTNAATIFTATGVAWYYILDTVNQRFKLPRTQYGFTGLRDTVEKYVEAGLPNITGTLCRVINQGTSTGAFVDSTTYAANWNYGSGGIKDVDIDASASNSIYGNSNSVQPPATQMYLYFYVGSFTQTAIENTAGLNASLFNGKADLDFGNTTMIDYVVEKQDPTALNNYTWYRKYKSGWVEQGGQIAQSGDNVAVTLPVEMADTNYSIVGGTLDRSGAQGWRYANRTTTGFTKNLVGSTNCGGSWIVSGIAA